MNAIPMQQRYFLTYRGVKLPLQFAEELAPDALTNRIIRRDIIPQFKAGNLPAGIVAGTDALIARAGGLSRIA